MKILDPELVTKLQKGIKAPTRAHTFSVSEIETVMALAKPLLEQELERGANREEVLQKLHTELKNQATGKVPDLKVFSQWLNGEVPFAIKRKAKIEQLELESLSEPQLKAIGEAILGRVSNSKICFHILARNIADFFGGQELLAKRLNLPVLDIKEAILGNPYLKQAVYSSILHCVGLRAEGKLAVERPSQSITLELLWSWLSSTEKIVANNYQGALLTACNEELSRGGNPRRVAHNKIKDYQKKSYS